MLLEDHLYQIFNNKTDYISFLRSYAPHAHTLNYYPPSFIIEVSKYCRQQINLLDNHGLPYTDKKHFANKEFKTDLQYLDNRSSGTTGGPFNYRIWRDTYNILEADNHYKPAASQFYISNPKVLYLFKDHVHNGKSFKVYKTSNPVLSHGFGQNAQVHHAYSTSMLIDNYLEYYRQIIEYCVNNEIDILLTSGSTIASLAYTSYKLKVQDKICKLMSNTNSIADYNKLNYLKSHNLIDNWCDHMRCWDGGATFITCPAGTKHLLDGLSWCYSIDGKLISDDYFSVTFPFFRYWNGDYCQIENDYKLCQCGRYYRPFIFNQPRGRSVKFADKVPLQQATASIKDVIRIESIGNVIRYFTHSKTDTTTKQAIRKSFPNNLILFETEQWNI